MHLAFEIDVSDACDQSKVFKTTTVELDFLMRTFGEAAVSYCPEFCSSEFILEFSKFYFNQSFQDKSEDFTKIKNKLKLEHGKETEEIKVIRNCFIENKTDVINAILSSAEHMCSSKIKDTLLIDFGHKGNYFTSSLFMPFVFSFDTDKKKIVHWPVAGPMNLNCRIIKHEIVNDLNRKIMAGEFQATSEISYAVPFKIVESEGVPAGDERGEVGSLFSEQSPEKPEFKNLSALHLESDDFVPLFQLFYVSFLINCLVLLNCSL